MVADVQPAPRSRQRPNGSPGVPSPLTGIIEAVSADTLKGSRWELKGPSSCTAELLPWVRGKLATLPSLVPWTGKTPSGPLLERGEAG